MNYYALPLTCECGANLIATQIGVCKEWLLAINFDCPSCKKSGGVEMEIAYYVGLAAENDDDQLTVQ